MSLNLRDRFPRSLGSARLIVELEPGGPEELPFPFAVQIVDVEITRAGELLEQHLRPRSVVAVFNVVSLDGDVHPASGAGPFVQVFATHPGEEA